MFAAYLFIEPWYDILVNRLYASLHMAMLAYVGFFSYTVFYRASGSRSPMVILLVVFILLGLLHNLPMRDVISPNLGVMTNWIMSIPNGGGQNALRVGIATGTIALYVRTVLGYEEAHTGG
jgi:hypothetical protein